MTTALSRPPIRRALRLAGVLAAAVALTLTTAVTPVLAAPAGGGTPAVTGQACLPGQGVTVAVDFTSAADADAGKNTGPIELGCAIGQQDNIADAAAAAG